MSETLKFEQLDTTFDIEGWEGLRASYSDYGFSRAKIPGGWIIVIRFESERSGFFVPDPDHVWDGRSLP